MSTPAQDEARARINDGWTRQRRLHAERQAATGAAMAARRGACRPAVECPFCGAEPNEPCVSADGVAYGQPGISPLYVHAARRALIEAGSIQGW